MAGNPNWQKVGLQLHFDGVNGSATFTDSSRFARTVTRVGTPTISTAQSAFGGASGVFSGTGQALSIANAGEFNPSGKAWTIEGRARKNAVGTARMIATKRGTGGGEWSVLIDTTGVFRFLAWKADANIAVDLQGGLVSAATWFAWAVARDTAGVWRLFLNGTMTASGAEAGALAVNPLDAVLIGSDLATYTDRYWDGYIDEVRITTECLYTGNYMPAVAAFPDHAGEVIGTVKDSTGSPAARTVRAYRRDTGALVGSVYTGAADANYSDTELLLHCDGVEGSTTFIDHSAQGRTVTVIGGAKITRSAAQFGGASAALNGAGDYVMPGVAADWTWLHQANAAWTIEGWFKVDSFAHTQTLFSTCDGTSTQFGAFAYLATDRTISVQVTRGVGSSFVVNAAFAAAFPNDTTGFHHVAICWDHSLASGNLLLFIDGVLVGTASKTANAPSAAAATRALRVGTMGVANTDFQGNFDEVRITKNLRRYTANFSVPPERFGDRANGAVGDYLMRMQTLDEVSVIALDDFDGTIENDLVLRAIPA